MNTSRPSLYTTFVTGLVLLLPAAGFSAEEPSEPVAIGQPVAGLTLTDLRLEPWSLEDAGPQQLYVFVFIDGVCAAVEDILAPLEALAKTYRDRDVFVAAINANTGESAVDAGAHALEHELSFPVFKDVHQRAKTLLGCERTPDAVVLDATRQLIYRGASVNESDGSFVLESVVAKTLAGAPLTLAERPGVGCLIRAPRPLGARKVTYEKHVAPILAARCVRCHAPDGPAPFSLASLDAARPQAEAIRRVVEERRMPPVFASEAGGTLLDQQPLSRKEIEILRLWHHSDAPGEALPPAPPPPTPDTTSEDNDQRQVETRSYEVTVTTSSRHILSLPVSKSVSRSLWLVDAELRPSAPGNVRHAWLLAHPAGGNRPYVVAAYTPEGSFFPKGKNRAMFVAERSRLVLRVDPYPDRKQECRVAVSLKNTFVPPTHEVACLPLVGPPFLLAPSPERLNVRRLTAAPEPGEVVAFVPMMSSFVRDLTLQIDFTGDRPDVLLRLPAFDPAWQRPYLWAPGPTYEFFAQIALVTHQEPPPERRIFGGWGPRSESHAGFIYYIRDPQPSER